MIAEVGGTVGDIEGLPFLEAIRQFKKDVGHDNVLYIHVTLIPYVGPWGEVKTKPTQHSVIKLREIGIQPDVLICRTRLPISQEMKNKISLFCDVDADAVIEAADAETIYEVPLNFEAAGLSELGCQPPETAAQSAGFDGMAQNCRAHQAAFAGSSCRRDWQIYRKWRRLYLDCGEFAARRNRS